MGVMRWELESLRTMGSGNISSSLTQIGSSFTRPLRMLAIYSTLDSDVILSFDGFTDHWFFPSKGSLILDVGANASNNDEYYIAQGRGVWVRYTGSEPTSGDIYVSTMFGSSL